MSGSAHDRVDMTPEAAVAHRRIMVDFDPGGADAFDLGVLRVSTPTLAATDTVAVLISTGQVDYSPTDFLSLRDLCPTAGPCDLEADVIFALHAPDVEVSFDWNAQAFVSFSDASTLPPGARLAISITDVAQAAPAPIIRAHEESVTLPVGVFGTADRWNLRLSSAGQRSTAEGRWLGLLTIDASVRAPAAGEVQTMLWPANEDDRAFTAVRGSGSFQTGLPGFCPTLPTCDLSLGLEANRPAGERPTDPNPPRTDEVDLEIGALLIWVGADEPLDEPSLELELTPP
jgi:hypothetical protein